MGAAEYSVGGILSGLPPGDNINLQNNSGDDLVLGNNGSFTFSTLIADGGLYAVTVSIQPTDPAHTCVVSGGNSGSNDGTGTIAGAADTSVVVSCFGDSIFSNSFE